LLFSLFACHLVLSLKTYYTAKSSNSQLKKIPTL
jgi:hypothetical protein